MHELNIDAVAVANGFLLVVAVIGGFATLWRLLILPGLTAVIRNEVNPIKKEFVVNGGESLKDATNRIENRLATVEGKIDTHAAWSAGVMAHNELIDPTNGT